jgi:hypothetical protein
VEAKARANRTGIDDIRNAVGVLTDVNQNFSRAQSIGNVPLQKFAYRYALFSTSGFSRPATDYALAHQISLVDLSTADFADIVRLADAVSQAIWNPDLPSRADGYIRSLRGRLRQALGTWPDELLPPSDLLDQQGPLAGSWRAVDTLLQEGVAAIGELFVAMANGPYLLVLRARNPRRVIQLLNEAPLQDVEIHWTASQDNRTRWEITLPNAPEGTELRFSLPRAIASWIFDPNADARRRAAQFKERFLSTITVYRYVDGRDFLYRLRFSRETTGMPEDTSARDR